MRLSRTDRMCTSLPMDSKMFLHFMRWLKVIAGYSFFALVNIYLV